MEAASDHPPRLSEVGLRSAGGHSLLGYWQSAEQTSWRMTA